MFQSTSKLPSIRTRGMHVAYPMATRQRPYRAENTGSRPITYWLPKPSYQMQDPYADIECKQAACNRLEASRHAYILDFSEKTTSCHSCIQLSCLEHQSRRSSLCCNVKENRSRDNGRQADRPRCCKRRRTIRKETVRAVNMSISWLVVSDMVTRSWRADHANMFVLSGVKRGRTLWSCIPFSMTLSNPLIPYFMTVYGCQAIRWAISGNDNPISQWVTILSQSNPNNCWYAFFIIIQGITRCSEQILTIESAFQMRNPLHNVSFIYCFDIVSPSWIV